MLTTLLISMTLLLAQPATAPAADAKLDKAQFMAAVERFMNQPAMGADSETIGKFAQESEDCLVGLSPDVLTWRQHKPSYAQGPVLTTAFVAGNVKAQLDSGKNADDPYAGLLSAIKVYEKLRAADASIKVPELDEMIALEKKGELKAWAEKAAQGSK
ncbi:MAG: hypothetical protein H7Z14_00050 [Anaerolineae bacterium]|nr:hypothetical protein [Phycisphaerae bacterium]